MVAILEYLSKAISILSLLIITYGIANALIAFIKNELSVDKYIGIRKVRANFGSYLLLGLELLIAADIIKTVVEPTYEELISLAGIVVLRTILSVFLNREIKELD